MAKRTSKTAEIVETQTLSPEASLAVNEGGLITGFLSGLKGFLQGRALELEQRANLNLAAARAMKPPTNKHEDDAVQNFVRGAKFDLKQVTDEWEITSLVHRFQRRLVAHRQRAEEPNKEAIALATRLHTTYEEQALRKAREEEDRINRERERAAREARERELEELDAKAVAAEASSPDLSDREQLFVSHYIRTGNAIDAARAAGYRDPAAQAQRLSGSEKVQKAVQAKRDAEVLRQQATAKREAPIEVERAEVKADVVTKGQRVTWSAELVDARLLVEAVLGGRHGIPADVLTVDTAKLNEYARSLQTAIDRWPGVRAKKTTTIV
jgi:hypothetical protein